MESWPAFKTGGGLQIRQSAGDDADIDSVEQSAESRYQQEEAVVAGFFIARHGGSLSRFAGEARNSFLRDVISACGETPAPKSSA
jgi:hypothetical protein